MEWARNVVSCGAGVTIILAHVTPVIGSPTYLPESGRSIKRNPNQVSVRFRKVPAKNGKRLGYIPGMHGYSATCIHTYDTE